MILATFLVSPLYHALRWTWANPTGYNIVSGIGSDLGELAIIGGLIQVYRQHVCHVHRCWRIAWHPHPDHGHPVCKRHHPDSRAIHAHGLNADKAATEAAGQ